MSKSQDVLSHEVILAIQRALELHPGPDVDPMDDLSDDFNPVGIINDLFPDGQCVKRSLRDLRLNHAFRGFSG